MIKIVLELVNAEAMALGADVRALHVQRRGRFANPHDDDANAKPSSMAYGPCGRH
jgi:hypothetical protein